MNTFRALDLNSDGFISREELLIGFKKIMCQSDAEEEVEKIMKNID